MKNENQFPFGTGRAGNQNGQTGIFIKLHDGQGQQHFFDIRPAKPINAGGISVTAMVTNINISNTSNVTNILMGSEKREKENSKDDDDAGDFWRSRI